MTPDELAAWLFARTTGGVRWGLERTEELLAGVGNPHRRFASVHIAGTNGKGSTAAHTAAALSAGGHRVGLYTSPHLVSFSERIRIDGRPVDDALLGEAAEALRPEIERTGATFFEAATAIAFLCFAQAGVEIAVVETGLGGRLDATNVIFPLATAVTNVALDHTEFLGDTLGEIAAEKAGIFKPGVPAVTAAEDAEVLRVLSERAAAVGAPFAALGADAVSEAHGGVGGTDFVLDSPAWGRMALRTPLVGAHQARNAALAAELLARLPGPYRPTREALAEGFARVSWPGRMQIELVHGTTWLFDAAHNPAGSAALARALDALDVPRPWVLLAGVLSDKAWGEMLPPLLERMDAAVLTVPASAPPERRWDVEAAARSLGPLAIPLRVIPVLAQAVQRASTLAPHGTVVVTGSFHTVGEAMEELRMTNDELKNGGGA